MSSSSAPALRARSSHAGWWKAARMSSSSRPAGAIRTPRSTIPAASTSSGSRRSTGRTRRCRSSRGRPAARLAARPGARRLELPQRDDLGARRARGLRHVGVSRRRRLVVGGRAAGVRAHRAAGARRARHGEPAHLVRTRRDPRVDRGGGAGVRHPTERGLQRRVAGRRLVHAVQHPGRRAPRHRVGVPSSCRGSREPRGRRPGHSRAVCCSTAPGASAWSGRRTAASSACRPARSSCAAGRSVRRSSSCSRASGLRSSFARSASTSSWICPASARTCTTTCSPRSSSAPSARSGRPPPACRPARHISSGARGPASPCPTSSRSISWFRCTSRGWKGRRTASPCSAAWCVPPAAARCG